MRKKPIPPKGRQFKPGQSGNPNGRPRKLPKLDDLLASIPEVEWALMLMAVIKKAKAGDLRAFEIIWDRAFGKPKEANSHNVELLVQQITGHEIIEKKCAKV